MEDADPGSRPPWRDRALRAVGPALALLSVLLAAVVHHGVGPPVGGDDPAWYHPRGVLRPALDALGLRGPAQTVPALMLPMAALAVAVALTTRSALARTLAVASTLAVGLFAYYGERLVVVWRIYAGHWSATLVLFALVCAGALCAVWLARSWRARSWPVQVATYLPVFAFLLVFERNVTGTDPALRFALSPWPLVQVFAMETFATAVAMLLLGVAAALGAFPALRPRLGAPAATALAAGLAVAVPVGGIGAGAELGLLPFRGGTRILALLGVLALGLLAGAVAARRGGTPARLRARGRLFATAALLLGAPLLLGQALTRLDYTEARDDRARRIIRALDAYYEREGVYPDALDALVEAGELERVPEPGIGFAVAPQPRFQYDSFGTSYMLEFAAPRWVQCAYNPPWEDELADAPEETDAAEGANGDTFLAGSWSCPSNPPELW